MTRREIRTLTLPALLVGALSTGCFTPADFGAGVAVEGHEAGDAHGEGEHANAEHNAAEHTAVEHDDVEQAVPAVPEGIQPGTTGKRLDIEVPEIEYGDEFGGKPIATRTVDGDVSVETFVNGTGDAVGESAVVEFAFKGYGTATGQQVMGSRAGPSKLVINDAPQTDPIAKALTEAMRGSKVGDKLRVKIPSSKFAEDAPPQLLSLGDLVMTLEIISTKTMAKLAGLDAYAGEPIATQKLDNGLEIYDYAPGDGPTAKQGDTVVTHYIGQLDDGTEFDSSHGRPDGLSGVANGPGLIKGFSQGLEGARAGMLRKLVIPPDIGYGAADRGKIPPNSTLVFFLEIQEVRDGASQTVTLRPNGSIDDTPKKPGKQPKPDKPEDKPKKTAKPADDGE